ncbi:serine/threonine protein kinase [Bythopirellula goksoeyrii]|uniref:non-specific serine/threonine protein kinase n=1 Tax=Bythopirellula goksoeyrii TaxID=1400387 RepID=A0A5B9QHA5_9BACT|nr:serine/threonine-protein kinase [Bythopirellula goksoeyrii]QEG33611.1 Serine/threonine-protein kinase StkP [Bythopirellula goksoeyrii]
MTLSAAEQHDIKLAEILTELADHGPAERPTLAELTATHPEFANDLRQLWGTAMLVDAVAHLSQSDITPLMTPQMILEMQPPNELGDFELLEEIGRGGMGIVYRALQKTLRREVALKLILQGAQASPMEKARFQAEVAAAARLEHPNIVPIYEVGESDGWQYFAMQLIEGQTLSNRITLGPVPEDEAVRLMLTIARAIAYAHSRGVIHRDLKPANILLDEVGMPHVTDFGLAKHVASSSSLTQSGTILGTPSFMAPEQADGGRGQVGPLSDVYSMGAILYSLLTGRAPFQGTSPVDTMLMVLEQDPLPPRLLNRRVNRDLEMITLKCLQKPSDLRYPSAEALADDFEAFLEGDSIAARSGRLTDIVARVFRETHHATVLENWGVLWMWHALVLLVMCLVTNWFYLERTNWPVMAGPWPYLALWGGGIAVWAPIFWALRHRAGPVTAVERQIAHAWGGSIVAVVLLFWVEALLKLPILTLSPVLGLISGMVFVVKGGILAGSFYFHAAALFAMSIVMAIMQRLHFEYGISVYGLVSAATFFIPGWKYYRQSRRNMAVPK